jgi:hypothetical protein
VSRGAAFSLRSYLGRTLKQREIKLKEIDKIKAEIDDINEVARCCRVVIRRAQQRAYRRKCKREKTK